jgi:hypothetical protein
MENVTRSPRASARMGADLGCDNLAARRTSLRLHVTFSETA